MTFPFSMSPPGLDESLAILLDVALKAGLLWTLARVAAALLGRRRAFARSAVWHACVLGWVLLPFTVSFLPRLRIECLPRGAPVAPGEQRRAHGVAQQPPDSSMDDRSALETAALVYEQALILPRTQGAPERPRSDAATEVFPSIAEPGEGAPMEGQLFDWRVALLAVYAAGAVYLAVRLVLSLLEVRRLGNSGVALRGPAWSQALEDWKRSLGVRRPVRIACSSSIRVPVVLGYFNPKILLPPDFVLTRLKKHRSSVLAHELAHVRRGDYVWQILTHVVRIAYWPHPLVWAMARFMERAREEACDDISVHLLRSARRYRAALLRVARLAFKRPALALGLTMARSNELGERVNRIENGCRSARCSVSWTTKCLLSCALLIVGSAVGALELARRDTNVDPGSFDRSLEIRVLQAGTSASIEGARVVSALAETVQSTSPPTDAEGRTRLEISSGAGWDGRTLRVRRDGFVPRSISWDGKTRGLLPTELTIELQPAGLIGGTVVDEQGQPVAGAIVRLTAPGAITNERVDLLEEPFETDSAGRWVCNLAPIDLTGLKIRVTHPEFVGLPPHSRSAEKLQDRSDVITLKRGLQVSGRVTDAGGTPLAGAAILEGSAIMRLASGLRVGIGNRVRSGTDGSFRLGCAASGLLTLTVEAPGCAPTIVKAQVTGDTPPLEIRLEPARAIAGRVVNAAGRPVYGARVEACRWQRAQNLGWSATTDSAGRFAWAEAPGDVFSLSVSKRGYVPLENQEVLGKQKELVFVLEPVLRVQGTAIDAQTGDRIRRFLVTRGSSLNGPVRWNDGSFPFEHGSFEIVFPRPGPGQVVRIEAEGYLPVVSRELAGDEGSPTIEIRLQPGEKLLGTVSDSAGRPVEAADVVAISPSKPARLLDGKIAGKLDADSRKANGFDLARTGPGGGFSLNPQGSGCALLILHEHGFAIVELEKASRPLAIALEPWGRVEGELRLGGKGVAGEKVCLRAESAPGLLSLESNATSTDEGHFALERVLPGEVRITHEVNLCPGSKQPSFESTRSRVLNVAAGKTASLVLGGAGRGVEGRMLRSASSTGGVDWSAGHVHLIQKNVEGLIEPARYAAPLRADGSFRIDDVAAGLHELSIEVLDRRPGATRGPGQEVASAEREVVVPAAEGTSTGAIDLGSIEVTVHRELAVGAPAPLFTVKTTTGETVRLEDLRGKVVLLDFWGTTCGPCVALTPALKQLHATFEQDGGFVILGLSLDDDLETVSNYAAKHRLPWVQGILGRWRDSTVRAEYGIAAIPRLLLIGRDGNIIAKDLLGLQGVKALVAAALGKKEERP